MSDYRRVLVAVDPTPGRQMIATTVRRMVDTSDAEITILHVVESQPWMGRAAHTLRLMNGARNPVQSPVPRGEPLAAHRMGPARGLHSECDSYRPRGCGADATGGDAGRGRGRRGARRSSCPVLLEWPVTAPVNHARVNPSAAPSNSMAAKTACSTRRPGLGALRGAADPDRARSARRGESGCALGRGCARARNRQPSRAGRGASRSLRTRRHDPDRDRPSGVRDESRAAFHGAGLLVAGGSRASVLAARASARCYTRARPQGSSRGASGHGTTNSPPGGAHDANKIAGSSANMPPPR